MDDAALLAALTAHLRTEHSLGEGAGGSGHLAEITLEGPELISREPDGDGVRARCAFALHRLGEMSSSTTRYEADATVLPDGTVRSWGERVPASEWRSAVDWGDLDLSAP